MHELQGRLHRNKMRKVSFRALICSPSFHVSDVVFVLHQVKKAFVGLVLNFLCSRRCALGYYGNPTRAGERCEPCGCNPHGAVSGVCDPVSGECSCRQGITGRACNKCQDRYALVNGICTCK